MKKISQEKYDRLLKLSSDDYIISALAIDQRGSLRKMLQEGGKVDDVQASIEEFKIGISEELTPFASSILLDPEYGLPASKKRDANAGLLIAYEETGYDASEVGRLPDLLPEWSAKRIKEAGGDAVKFLLYYDPDEKGDINTYKQAFTERIGSECRAEGIPFFLEVLSYDADINDDKGAEFAKIRPQKVIDAVKEFSKDRYDVDVLKVEIPVNLNYLEGYGEKEAVYTKEDALYWFKELDKVTNLPYIYLSGGVSAKLFQDGLLLAHEAGNQFNGVLCGRATWRGSVDEYVTGGDQQAREWLKTQGRENIETLNEVIDKTAISWKDKIGVE